MPAAGYRFIACVSAVEHHDGRIERNRLLTGDTSYGETGPLR